MFQRHLQIRTDKLAYGFYNFFNLEHNFWVFFYGVGIFFLYTANDFFYQKLAVFFFLFFGVFLVFRLQGMPNQNFFCPQWLDAVIKLIQQIFRVFVWQQIKFLSLAYRKRRKVFFNVFLKAVVVGNSFRHNFA